MRLFGIWVAKNEADIIRETLEYHRANRFYERIFFFDLGSTDATLDIAMEYRDILHDPRKLKADFSGQLRLNLIKECSGSCEEGDWLALIDSDEMYAESPVEILGRADSDGAVQVECAQANFYFTDADLQQWETNGLYRSAPVSERLRYYLINWGELRFYKYFDPARNNGECLKRNGRLYSQRLINRHYPYRSPEQIQERIRVRIENRRTGHNSWFHLPSEDWRDYVIDHTLLHRLSQNFEFGVPAGVNWKQFYNWWANDVPGWHSIAYNNLYIQWMMNNRYVDKWSFTDLCKKGIGKLVQKLRRRDRIMRWGNA